MSRRQIQNYIVHDTKERPHVRAIIEREGWTPQILGDSAGRYWDGYTVSAPNGRRETLGGDGLKKQLMKMAAWGEFGDVVAHAQVDFERYHYIQDRLLEWPDESAIQHEGLHRVEGVTLRKLRPPSA